jgi:NlpE N-terminal domain
MFRSTVRLVPNALKFRPYLLTLLAIGLSGCAQMQQAGYYNPPPASTITDAIAQGDGIYNNQTLRAPSQIQIGLQQPNTTTRTAATAAPTPSAVAANPGTTAPGSVAGLNLSSGAPVASAPYSPVNAPAEAPPVNAGSNANPASSAATAPTESLQATLIPEPQSFAGTLPCFHPEMKCSAQRVTITLAPNGRWRARAAYLEQNSKNSAVQTDQGCWRASAQAVPRVVLLNSQGNVRAELGMTSGDVLRLISMNGGTANLTYNLTRQPDLDSIDELKGKPAPNCP